MQAALSVIPRGPGRPTASPSLALGLLATIEESRMMSPAACTLPDSSSRGLVPTLPMCG